MQRKMKNKARRLVTLVRRIGEVGSERAGLCEQATEETDGS